MPSPFLHFYGKRSTAANAICPEILHSQHVKATVRVNPANPLIQFLWPFAHFHTEKAHNYTIPENAPDYKTRRIGYILLLTSATLIQLKQSISNLILYAYSTGYFTLCQSYHGYSAKEWQWQYMLILRESAQFFYKAVSQRPMIRYPLVR